MQENRKSSKVIEYSWLIGNGSEYVSIHPVISDVIRYKYNTDFNYAKTMIQSMIEYLKNPIDIIDFIEIIEQCKSVIARFKNENDIILISLIFIVANLLVIFNEKEKATGYLEYIIDLCKDNIENDYEIGACEFIKGKKNAITGDYEEAIKRYETAYNHCKEDTSFIARIYEEIGSCYCCISDFSKAIEFYKEALSIYKELSIEENVARCYEEIAFVLFQMGKDEEAIDFYQKHSYLKEIQNSNEMLQIDNANYKKRFDDKIDKGLLKIDSKLYIQCIIAESDSYCQKKEYEKALRILNEALEKTIEVLGEENKRVARLYIHIGDVYVKQNNTLGLLQCYNKLLSFFNDGAIVPNDRFTFLYYFQSVFCFFGILASNLYSKSNISTDIDIFTNIMNITDNYYQIYKTEYAYVIYYLGSLFYSYNKDSERAMNCFNKANELKDKALSIDSPNLEEVVRAFERQDNHFKE